MTDLKDVTTDNIPQEWVDVEIIPLPNNCDYDLQKIQRESLEAIASAMGIPPWRFLPCHKIYDPSIK